MVDHRQAGRAYWYVTTSTQPGRPLVGWYIKHALISISVESYWELVFERPVLCENRVQYVYNISATGSTATSAVADAAASATTTTTTIVCAFRCSPGIHAIVVSHNAARHHCQVVQAGRSVAPIYLIVIICVIRILLHL